MQRWRLFEEIPTNNEHNEFECKDNYAKTSQRCTTIGRDPTINFTNLTMHSESNKTRQLSLVSVVSLRRVCLVCLRLASHPPSHLAMPTPVLALPLYFFYLICS